MTELTRDWLMADQTQELIERLSEPFQEFANGFGHGYCKAWKATGIIATVASMKNPDLDEVTEYVRRCLEIEGFRSSECDAIAGWLYRKWNVSLELLEKV